MLRAWPVLLDGFLTGQLRKKLMPSRKQWEGLAVSYTWYGVQMRRIECLHFTMGGKLRARSTITDPQAYTRTAVNLYLYESLDSDFSRQITVDADGFVIDYPGLYSRNPPPGWSQYPP